MEEILQRVLQDLTLAMTTSDADLEFIANLQTAIIKKLREPDEMLSQMQQQSGPAAAPAMPPGMPPGMGAPAGMGGGQPGVMSSPNAQPVADELRRMMS